MNGTRIKWDCHEIRITMTKLNRDGTKDSQVPVKRLSVYPEFGEARQRLIQSIASAVGGPIVWFRAVSGDNRTTAIPVASVIGNSSNDVAVAVSKMLDSIQVARDVDRLEVFGSDRISWSLGFENIAQARDSLSDGSDRMTTGDSVQSEGGLRDEF